MWLVSYKKIPLIVKPMKYGAKNIPGLCCMHNFFFPLNDDFNDHKYFFSVCGRLRCQCFAVNNSLCADGSVIFSGCMRNCPRNIHRTDILCLLHQRKAFWVSISHLDRGKTVAHMNNLRFNVSLTVNMLLFFLGMTKVKVGKEDPSSAEFVERRRASLERSLITQWPVGYAYLYIHCSH